VLDQDAFDQRASDIHLEPRREAGAIRFRIDGALPTAFGEKMVMRIFDPQTVSKGVDALGFSPADALRWNTLVAKPHGIILVTGPTGSGKTKTLYATLKQLATDEV
jgi:general secretion pathway protein E